MKRKIWPKKYKTYDGKTRKKRNVIELAIFALVMSGIAAVVVMKQLGVSYTFFMGSPLVVIKYLVANLSSPT